jgi:hypothetical protein
MMKAVLWIRKYRFIPVPDLALEKFQFRIQIQIRSQTIFIKVNVQNLAFLMLEAALFSRKSSSHF